MQNYLDNINLEKIKQFFIQNKLIIIIGISAGILINSVDIFNYKFGIDSEGYIKNNFAGFNEQQRYGSYLLMLAFPFLKYHTISQIAGIIFLVFAGLLTISKHNISNTAKMLFVLLFISYPNFAFLQYFFFQSAFNFIAVFLAVVSYRLIESTTPPLPQLKNITIIIISIFLLFISISSYQSTIAVFLTVMMINVILDYIENYDMKKSIKTIFLSIFILVSSIIIYALIVFITSKGIDSYQMNKTFFSNNNLIDAFNKSFTHIYRLVLGTYNFKFTLNLAGLFLFFITLIYVLFTNKNINKLFFIFLYFLLIVSTLSLNFAINLPARAILSFAFYFSFLMMFCYILMTDKFIKLFILSASLICFIYHTNYIVKYQTSYYMTYENDRTTAVNMINAINETAPDASYGRQYKIAFAGTIYTKNKSNLIVYNDTFGASFFWWDRGNPARMLAFLELMGLPANFQLTNPNIYADKFKSMPHWPAKGYTQLHGDTVLVNLMW